jgi:hypothetical protein
MGLLQSFSNLKLILVDPWEKAPMMNNPTMPKTESELSSAYDEAMSLTEFASDRRIVLRDTSEAAATQVEDGSLDFVFIDGVHMYEIPGGAGVHQDTQLWFPKVKEGGIVSGHDYNGHMDQKGIWGVKRAVDELVAEHGFDLHIAGGLVWWFVKESVLNAKT